MLGEEWNDASPWLLGTEADGVMNYRFRRAVIGLVNGDTADLDGSIAGLTPSAFASAMEGVREDYPAPAWQALLNLVDSHDTTRILWTLTPGAENSDAKEAPDALATGKAKLRQVAALQLSWPGMASIYYGDEVGLTGQDDPDDRRTYPWGAEDTGAARLSTRPGRRCAGTATPCATATCHFLLADDDAGTLAYVRRTDAQAAITVLNLSDAQQVVRSRPPACFPTALALDGVTDAAGPCHHQRRRAELTLPARGYAVLLTPRAPTWRRRRRPAGAEAAAAPGQVNLAWEAVAGAVGYTVWRSVLAGGGYLAIGATAGTSFADDTARNGTRYHYVITAADAAGNASASVPERPRCFRRSSSPTRGWQVLPDVPATLRGGAGHARSRPWSAWTATAS